MRTGALQATVDGRFVALYGQEEYSIISNGNPVNVFDVPAVIDAPNGAFDVLIQRWLPDHPDALPAPPAQPPRHPRPAQEYGADDFRDDAAWIAGLDRHAQLIKMFNGPGTRNGGRESLIGDVIPSPEPGASFGIRYVLQDADEPEADDAIGVLADVVGGDEIATRIERIRHQGSTTCRSNAGLRRRCGPRLATIGYSPHGPRFGSLKRLRRASRAPSATPDSGVAGTSRRSRLPAVVRRRRQRQTTDATRRTAKDLMTYRFDASRLDVRRVMPFTGAVFLLAACHPSADYVSWDIDECSVEGEVEWEVEGASGSLPLGTCMAVFEEGDDADVITLVLWNTGSGAPGYPAENGFNIEIGLEPGGAARSDFSVPITGRYDLAMKDSPPAGEAYAIFSESGEDALVYQLHGELHGSGLDVSVEEYDHGSLRLNLAFRENRVEHDEIGERMGGSGRVLTMSGEAEIRARSIASSSSSGTAPKGSCTANETGICSELRAGDAAAFKSHCESQTGNAASRYSSSGCFTGTSQCRGAKSTSNGKPVTIDLHYPASFCSNYSHIDIHANCTRLGGTPSGPNCGG